MIVYAALAWVGIKLAMPMGYFVVIGLGIYLKIKELITGLIRISMGDRRGET